MSNRTEQVIWTPESVFGVTPAAGPDWETLTFSRHSLKYEPSPTDSDEMSGQTHPIMLEQFYDDRSVGGDIEGHLHHDQDHFFLSSVMGGSWSGNSLTPGYEVKSASIESKSEQITNGWQSFRGMVCTAWKLAVAPKARARVTRSFLGVDGSVAGAANSVGAGTLAAAVTTPPMKSGGTLTGVLINGSAPSVAGARINDIEFSLTRNFEEQMDVASDYTSLLTPQDLLIELKLSIYFDTLALYAGLVSGTPITFDFKIEDSGGESYDFTISGLNPQSGPPDQQEPFSVGTQTLSYKAFGSTNPLTIVRS